MIPLRFRPARPAPTWKYLLKTLIQAAFFWTTFLLVIPYLIYLLENVVGIRHFTFEAQGLVALGGFGLASCLGVWSGVTMAVRGKGTPFPSDTARELVIAGPYRYVRNPMAVAGLAQGAFVGIGLGSCGTLIYVLAGMVLWNTIVRPIEEADLAERFGDEFQRYRHAVRCWVPKFRSVFNSHDSHPAKKAANQPHPIILFDGVCNLCNASVQFIIARDSAKRFRFASRESEIGRELLRKHGLDPERDDTIVFVQAERSYLRSTAALHIARRLRWPWPLLFALILVPRFLRDWGYNWVAKNRYRWFGKSDACGVPEDHVKDRFLS